MIKNISLSIVLFLLIFSACNTELKEQQNAIEQITKIETQLVNDTTAFINQKNAKQLIERYNIYSGKYPSDSLAPEYLFKAGELAMNLNHSTKAIVYLNRLEKAYPTHSKIPYSIFFQAFVYENQMNNLEKAELYYQKFINEFPDHELTDDAKTSIQNLGKPLDEIIQEFESGNPTQ